MVVVLGLLSGVFTGVGVGFYRSTALLLGSTIGLLLAGALATGACSRGATRGAARRGARRGAARGAARRGAARVRAAARAEEVELYLLLPPH